MRRLYFWSQNKLSRSTTSSVAHHKRQPNAWQMRFFRWIDKRSPVSRKVKLTRKNLYILPTATGFSFFLLSFILWLLGTSYQNNLVLALSYLLISLIVVAIFHTYANLAGLQIKVLGCKPVFVGENADFILQTEGLRDKGHDNLIIRWWDGEDACFDFKGENNTQIQVSLYADKRGIIKPGKLLIESVFPLGIIRCWTWLNLQASAIAFPEPLKVKFPTQRSGVNESEQGEQVSGSDDFSGLKEYRAGDPIKHIAWKHYAREQGLYSKEYTSTKNQDSWLDWNDFLHLQPEARLSALCYWCVQFDRLQITYGLRLPGKEILPALNDSHRLNVLSTLALFNINQSWH